MLAPVLLALAAVVGSTAVAASAAVTPGTASPMAATGAGHRLFAVSCTSAKNCVGVGVNSAADAGKGGPLAES